ncbi:hypothetical protein CYMTET_21062 [Cymbomonas tetramitiformis]|uniref:SAP domain-containing protein n=1 Tax=Cymbomonas tetramitiformis TaxID=36881 RepID=A0AAE0F442_9CHLO|nr:hypothetical protein CYMTET_39250 [Cymbomonas tetramitiformis]KAK3269192.1 hypothetical protein CYMTET_22348 [Cymbomonas tetramitiformis]KAK3270542.1 hypothetical protein CYMTET_21062 [Cymbomonas tetramitiformis]
MEGIEPPVVGGDAADLQLFFDALNDTEDFLDEVVATESDEPLEVCDVEHLVQGSVNEVSTCTTIGSELSSPPATTMQPPAAGTETMTPQPSINVTPTPSVALTDIVADLSNVFSPNPNPTTTQVNITVNEASSASSPSRSTLDVRINLQGSPQPPRPSTLPTQAPPVSSASLEPIASAPHATTVHMAQAVSVNTTESASERVCYVCNAASPFQSAITLTICEKCDLAYHHICATQFRCPRCTPETNLAEDKRPPVPLADDIPSLLKMSASQLVEQCRLRQVGKSGNKGVLIDRLTKAIQKAAVKTASVPPQQTPRTRQGTAPTAPEGAKTTTAKKIKKPETIDESPWVDITQEQAAAGRWTRPEYTGPEKGRASAKANRLLNPRKSTPIDYLNAFIPEAERYEKWKNNSNMYATHQGASTEKYPDFTPFTAVDMDCILGLHVRNGLSPVPDMRYNFTNPETSFVFGDSRVIDTVPGGFRRFKEFKAFFHIQDPRLLQPPDQPFWKVAPLLEVLRSNSEELYDPGEDISLDEQDAGFQGRCAFKDKIKYKKEGDGFLADCLCDDGYTWTFHFRHDPTPLPLTQQQASDLHNRCLLLVKRLKFDWNRIWMDNLFTSRRFIQWGYQEKVLMGGVARPHARGVPESVIQSEARSKADLERAVGTVKVARTADFKIVAVSIYDSKPVHFLTSIHSKVSMVDKVRQIWDAQENKKKELPFKRLNVIDDYNFNMNGVDIADQLREIYRFDGPWMRQRKWWWAVFLWACGVAVVNAYILYKTQCEEGLVPKKERLSHLQFNALLARELCSGERAEAWKVAPVGARKRAASSAAAGPSSGAKRPRGMTLTPKTLRETYQRRTSGKHAMKDIPGQIRNSTECQWCKFRAKFAYGGQAVKALETKKPPKSHFGCKHCEVWFCGVQCWNEFHHL